MPLVAMPASGDKMLFVEPKGSGLVMVADRLPVGGLDGFSKRVVVNVGRLTEAQRLGDASLLDIPGARIRATDSGILWEVRNGAWVNLGGDSVDDNGARKITSQNSKVLPASHFGFKRGPLPIVPTTDDEILSNTEISSSSALLDFFQNWIEKNDRPAIIDFEAGFYRTPAFKFKQNPNVFYPRSGLLIRGAGSAATTIAAVQSSEPSFVSLDGLTNWTQAPKFQSIRLYGAGLLNPDQIGLFLNPAFVNSLGFGGYTGGDWDDVIIENFCLEQLWVRGGAETYNVPIQYATWRNITCHAFSKNASAMKFTGQMGPPLTLDNPQAYGRDNFVQSTIAASTSKVIRVGDTRGLRVDQSVIGAGIPANTVIQTITNLTDIIVSQIVNVGSNVELTFGSIAEPLIYIGVDNRTGLIVAAINEEPNVIRFAKAHRLKTSDKFQFDSGTAWGGLALNTPYFAYVVDEFRLKVASSLANATTPTPNLLTLIGSVGTATVSVVATPGVSLTSPQLILVTPTVQGGSNGIEVNGGNIAVLNLHAENLKSSITAKTESSIVSVLNASVGNGGQGGGSGVVFQGINGGTIILDGAINVTGRRDKMLDGYNVRRPSHGFTGSYLPTTGDNLRNSNGFFQVGNDGPEYDLRQRINSEFLFNSGPNTVVNVKAQAEPGDWFLFEVFEVTGLFLEFSPAGNLKLMNRNIVGNTLRIPAGATGGFYLSGFGTWRLNVLELPVHNLTWATGGAIAASAVVSQNVTCGGARIGDLKPQVTVNFALPSIIKMEWDVTANDVVTVKFTNTTGASVVLPNSVVISVKQVR